MNFGEFVHSYRRADRFGSGEFWRRACFKVADRLSVQGHISET